MWIVRAIPPKDKTNWDYPTNYFPCLIRKEADAKRIETEAKAKGGYCVHYVALKKKKPQLCLT